jgi:hypothetical protein
MSKGPNDYDDDSERMTATGQDDERIPQTPR